MSSNVYYAPELQYHNNNTNLFTNDGNPVVTEQLPAIFAHHRASGVHNPCPLYNAHPSVIFRLSKRKIKNNECPFDHLSGCKPKKDHFCILCGQKHRARDCILLDLDIGTRWEMNSNSNGCFNNGGSYLRMVRTRDNFSEKSANLDRIIQNYENKYEIQLTKN